MHVEEIKALISNRFALYGEGRVNTVKLCASASRASAGMSEQNGPGQRQDVVVAGFGSGGGRPAVGFGKGTDDPSKAPAAMASRMAGPSGMGGRQPVAARARTMMTGALPRNRMRSTSLSTEV